MKKKKKKGEGERAFHFNFNFTSLHLTFSLPSDPTRARRWATVQSCPVQSNPIKSSKSCPARPNPVAGTPYATPHIPIPIPIPAAIPHRRSTMYVLYRHLRRMRRRGEICRLPSAGGEEAARYIACRYVSLYVCTLCIDGKSRWKGAFRHEGGRVRMYTEEQKRYP